MASFGSASLRQLGTCHPELQRLFLDVVLGWDCQVLEGKRTEAQQRINVARGVSKTMQSKHVYPLNGPSLAVDVAPYPLRWPKRPDLGSMNAADWLHWAKDLGRFYFFAGYVRGRAEALGIKLRLGADWNGNGEVSDQSFDDLPHYEIVEG